MNALQIRELNRRAKLESNTEINENKKVYAIDKSRMFRKVACFFSMSQVEAMA